MEPEGESGVNYTDDDKLNSSLEAYISKRGNDPARVEKYVHFYNMAREKGVVHFRLARLAEEYTDDYFADTGVNREDKEWYYERGIPTFKTGWCGLNKSNYNDFISDYDFYSPENYLKKPQMIKWYDYKLTTYYVLNAFREYMPRHYFYIQNGGLLPIDNGINRAGSMDDVIAILNDTPVALKACTGGHGKGFYKIEYRDREYYVNNVRTDIKDLSDLLLSLDDYLLTSYSIPHKMFREACGNDSFVVLRTVTVFDKEDGPQVTGINVRLGTSRAGIVSDYDGCIYCGVDLNSGRLFDPIIRGGDKDGILTSSPVPEHPDTGYRLTDLTVPDFGKLLDTVKKVSSHLSMTPYLVADIVPTDNGFEILEINSHGQVRNLEPFYPFRKNEYNLKVFKTKDW